MRKLCMVISILFCVMLVMPGFIVSAQEDTVRYNVTRNNGVTVNATAGQPIGMIDGDTLTGSGTNPATGQSYVWSYAGNATATLDLGAYYDVTELRLYLGYSDGNNRPIDFDIKYSTDGSEYITVYSVTGNDQATYIKTLESSMRMRYIQIAVTAFEGDHFRIREIEVYGTFDSYAAVNLTQNEGVSASATNGNASAPGLIDGENTKASGTNPDTNIAYAWSYNGKGEVSATVDLGNCYSISQIKLYLGYPGGTDKPEAFRLTYSDNNVIWYPIDDITETAEKYDKTIGQDIIARYLKMTVPTVETARTVRVREMEIYGVNVPVINFARQSGVKASGGNKGAEYLIDGVTTANEFCSLGTGRVTIDLGFACNISKFNLYLGYTDGNVGLSAYEILYSNDGANFVKCAEKTDIAWGTKTSMIELENSIHARYIGVQATAFQTNPTNQTTYDYGFVRELEIFGMNDTAYYTKSEDGLTYRFVNNKSRPMTPVVIVADYDDNNVMTACAINQISNLGGLGGTAEVGFENTPEHVFVWESLGSMIPMYPR